MISLTSRNLKIVSILGLICLFVPLYILGLWIHAFNAGATQIERVEIFEGYFPGFLQGRFAVTIMSNAFCILVIIFGSIGLKLNVKSWKALNTGTLVLGLLLLALNLFQIM